MDEIPERYNLQNIEQMRGIADTLRLSIFEALAQRAMTATQVGEELNIAAPKAHYHVRELERLGLVRLVETRERGGILEKYYRAVARNLIAPPQLLQTAEPEEVAAAVNELFSNISQSFMKAMARYFASGSENPTALGPHMNGVTIWLTPQELNDTMKKVEEMFSPFQRRRGLPDEREARLMFLGFDAQLAEQDDGEAPEATPPPGKESPRRRSIVSVGAVIYSRDELERVVAAGEQLDLDVAGFLSFREDVTPELVDKAIAHLRYRGILSAPADVRKALERKEI